MALKLVVVTLVVLLNVKDGFATAALDNFRFVMLPGQSFHGTPCNGCPPDTAETWYVAEWGASKTCVVQNGKPNVPGAVKPFALLTLGGNATCPVGAVFDITTATPDREQPWKPYPTATAKPKDVVFTPAAGHELDPGCTNNTLMVANRIALNKALASLQAGDVFTLPKGTHCMAAGVYGLRLSHVTLDIQGEMHFNQDPQEWSNGTDAAGASTMAHGILLQGVTNMSITSSSRTGLIKSNGCLKWYVQRLRGEVQGPPPLVEVGADPELSFASSKIIWEHMTVQDGPNWQTYWNKVTDLTIRYVKVDITCIPPVGTIPNMLGALAENTDGIDIWGSNVHVHDVEVTNGDDCICVKGDNDGSRIWSENWIIENSKARGEGLSVGTVWSGHFLIRNVTFRNIEMLHTRKGIYVKIDSQMNYAEVVYQNISIHGPTLQFPVFIGPIHQFTHTSCDWDWPYFQVGTCSVRSNAQVNISIDGLKIIRPNGFPGYYTSDFLIMGNNQSSTTVTLKNIHVEGKVQSCDDPPCTETAIGGACNNACLAANVLSDGSYHVTCTPWDAPKLAAGKCAPLMGQAKYRCASGKTTKTKLCYSGMKCS